MLTNDLNPIILANIKWIMIYKHIQTLSIKVWQGKMLWKYYFIKYLNREIWLTYNGICMSTSLHQPLRNQLKNPKNATRNRMKSKYLRWLSGPFKKFLKCFTKSWLLTFPPLEIRYFNTVSAEKVKSSAMITTNRALNNFRFRFN